MNNKNKSENKVIPCLLALIFTLAFSLAALLVGILPLSKVAWYWTQTQYYQPVQAQLSELKILSDPASGEIKLSGRIQYAFQSDQLDLRQQTLLTATELDDEVNLAELYEHYQKSRQLHILVHPSRPHNWLLQREISIRKLWPRGLTALIFSLIALASSYVGLSIWRRTAQVYAQPDQPLKLDSERLSLAAFLFASLFWNGIAWPLSYLALFNEQGQFRFGWQIFVVIFPLVGIYLVLAMLKQLYRDWQIGPVSLTSARQLSNADEVFTLSCHFELPLGQRFSQQHSHYPITARLVCKHTDRNGDNETVTVLFEENYPAISVVHGAQSCQFRLPIKADLPATQSYDSGSQDVSWELSLSIADCTVQFKLPVLQGRGDEAVKPSSEVMRDIRDRKFQREYTAEQATALLSRIKLVGFLVLFAALSMAFVFYRMHLDDNETVSQETEQQQPIADKVLDTASLKQKIAEGANLNQFDQDGQTLLMHAAGNADLEQVQLLLAHGADVNLATDYVGDIGGRTALFNAIQRDAIEVVRALLRAGANAQQVSNRVWTPVHYAAYAGALQSLRELAASGLDLQQKFAGGRGSTPLMIAAQYQQIEIINYLLHVARVDPTLKDNYGEDACGYARFFKQAASAKALACP